MIQAFIPPSPSHKFHSSLDDFFTLTLAVNLRCHASTDGGTPGFGPDTFCHGGHTFMNGEPVNTRATFLCRAYQQGGFILTSVHVAGTSKLPGRSICCHRKCALLDRRLASFTATLKFARRSTRAKQQEILPLSLISKKNTRRVPHDKCRHRSKPYDIRVCMGGKDPDLSLHE